MLNPARMRIGASLAFMATSLSHRPRSGPIGRIAASVTDEPVLKMEKNRLPTPDVTPAESVTTQAIVCRPFAYSAELMPVDAERRAQPGIAGKGGSEVGTLVPAARAADADAVDVDGDGTAAWRIGAPDAREYPPEVRVAAADRLTLPRGVDRTKGLSQKVVPRGNVLRAERRETAIEIEGVRVEREVAHTLIGEHVGQHHEAPAGAVVERRRWADGLHIGPRIVDHHGIAEINLIRSARRMSALLAGHRTPADRHARDAHVIDGPAGYGNGAGHRRAVRRRIDRSARRRRRPQNANDGLRVLRRVDHAARAHAKVTAEIARAVVRLIDEADRQRRRTAP